MADIQLIRGSNGNGPAVRPVVTAARSSGSLTIKVNSTTNLPSSFIGTWGKLNQDTGKLISSSIRDFYGTVNGADIDLVRMADGFTDDGNAVGDVIVIKPNTDWTHNLADVLEVSHKPDGTIKANSVTTAAIPDGAVTAEKKKATTFDGEMTGGSITASYKNFASQVLPSTSVSHKYLIAASFSINNSNQTVGREYTVAIRNGSTVVRSSRTDSPSGTYRTYASVSAIITSSGDTINFSATVNTTPAGSVLDNSHWTIVDLGLA